MSDYRDDAWTGAERAQFRALRFALFQAAALNALLASRDDLSAAAMENTCLLARQYAFKMVDLAKKAGEP